MLILKQYAVSNALCDPIWHVSSRSGAVLVAQTAIRFLTLSPENTNETHLLTDRRLA